jgi:hypothetical protein
VRLEEVEEVVVVVHLEVAAAPHLEHLEAVAQRNHAALPSPA